MAWDPAPGSGIAGYKIYYGAVSGAYTNLVVVTNGTQTTLTGMRSGTTYFLAATAFDTNRIESAYSAEVSYTFPAITSPPPAIVLTSPTSGATYSLSSSIRLTASVTTNGHAIASVRFYNGSTLLGADSLPPYTFTLTHPTASSYSFSAQVVFDNASTVNSAMVTVVAIGSAPTLALSAKPASNHQVALVLTGQSGHTYDILATQDFKIWTAIATATIGASGTLTFADPASASYSKRFYRLHETTYTLPGTLPTLKIHPASGGLVLLDGEGQIGHIYDILASQDLKIWTAIDTVTIGASGSFAFTDPDAPRHPSRFYRLHETTYTPPESLPKLQLQRVPGKLMLNATGQVGHTYDVLATRDFAVWTAITNVTAPANGVITFTDPAAALYSSRFYRLRETTYKVNPLK